MLRASAYMRTTVTVSSRMFLRTTILLNNKIKYKLGAAVEHEYDLYLDKKPFRRSTDFRKRPEVDRNRALRVLRENYGDVQFVDDNNKVMDISKLRAHDIQFRSKASKELFKNLLRVKEISGRQINRFLARTLLGTDEKQMSDKFYVTMNVTDLLAADRDITRALYLCRLTKNDVAVAAMNVITQFVLSTGEVNEGLKLFNRRKSYGILSDNYTYITLFDGMAKALAWGKANSYHVDSVMEIFRKWRADLAAKSEQFPVEGFNACLSVLVKDFRNRQAKAWGLFDELMEDKENGLPRIHPNAQTFTILIHGVNMYFEREKLKVVYDKTLTKDSRTLQLLDLQGGHARMAEIVFNRAKALATPPPPPPPPTSENSVIDQEAHTKAVRTWNRTKVEIDMPLVSVYVSALSNMGSGTGEELQLGSHYIYRQAALKILQQVSPEIRLMLKFVECATSTSPFRIDGTLMKNTDRRIKSAIDNCEDTKFIFAEKAEQVDPRKVIADMKIDNFNPELSRPGFKLFSPEPEPLINFLRKVDSKSQEKYGINKFLLRQVFDCLINMGKLNEFVIAFYYALFKWGGVNVNLAVFENRPFVLDGVLTPDSVPKNGNRKPILSIMDDRLVDWFVDIISERYNHKGMTRSNLIVELFSILCSKEYNPEGVIPYYKSIDRVWKALEADLNYCNKYNHGGLLKLKDDVWTYEQISLFSKNLAIFTATGLDWTKNVTGKKKLPKEYSFSLIEILKRLLFSKWKFSSVEERIHVYKLITKAGIMFYLPSALVPKVHHDRYPTVLKRPLGYLESTLSQIDDLTESNVKLLTEIRKIGTLNNTSDPKDKMKIFQKIRKNIYDLIDLDDTKVVNLDKKIHLESVGHKSKLNDHEKNREVEEDKKSDIESNEPVDSK